MSWSCLRSKLLIRWIWWTTYPIPMQIVFRRVWARELRCAYLKYLYPWWFKRLHSISSRIIRRVQSSDSTTKKFLKLMPSVTTHRISQRNWSINMIWLKLRQSAMQTGNVFSSNTTQEQAHVNNIDQLLASSIRQSLLKM